MDRQMYRKVNEAFHRLNSDDDAAVAIFSSDCEKAFCAGVDIKDVHHAVTKEGVGLENLRGQFDIFFEVPGALKKPVIAAINGHCVGEGMVMTLFCDIRIAAEDAQFSLPEAKIGVPSINGTIRAVQLAGHGAAMELVLTGEARDAAWALNAGLVNAVVPAGELMVKAEVLATSIAGNDALACQIMREIGDRALDEKFADALEFGMTLRDKMPPDAMIDRQEKFVQRSGSKT
jgi:enoyl-CoA hydratase/carnithine racemase